MSLQPIKGTCDGRNGRYNSCGATDVYLACKSRGQCIRCSGTYKKEKNKGKRTVNSIKIKQGLAQLEFIVNSREYYLKAIVANQNENGGICRCDECNEPIMHPTGKNVSHIVGSGANKKLYHEKINNKILCSKCENIWTNGSKRSMKIFPECERIRIMLTNKYYTKKPDIN